MLKKNFGKKVTILYISFHFFIYGEISKLTLNSSMVKVNRFYAKNNQLLKTLFSSFA